MCAHYLTAHVTHSKGAENPSLTMHIPFELIRHRHYGNGHNHPIRRVDEIRQRA